MTTKEQPYYSYTCTVCGTEFETQAPPPPSPRPRKREYWYCTDCCKTTAHKTHRIS